MKKQFLTALIFASVISSSTFTMDTIIMSNDYEPLPAHIPKHFITEQVIAARKAREERKLALRTQLTELTTRQHTLLAIVAATRRN